jgi:Glycosyl transferase family 2
MSSWLREIPKIQGGIKQPQEVSQVQGTDAGIPVSTLEVKQWPAPERRQRAPAPVPYYEIATASTEVKQFPAPERRQPAPPSVPYYEIAVEATEVKQFPAPEKRVRKPQAPSYSEPRVVAVPVSNEVKQFPAPERRALPQQQQPQRQQQQQAVQAKKLASQPAMKQIPRPSNPSVTVIIPLYNGLEFLEGSLESVRRQTYKNWVGLIGINGHGKTGEPVLSKVKALITSLGMSDVFEVINLPDAKGAPTTITELAANNATTAYVAHLDCDDIWLPKKLETQMKAVEEDPEIGILGTMCRYFGESSDIPNLPAGTLRRTDFEKKNPLIHSSILIRRELAVYTDEFFGIYDYDCWLRNITADVKIANIDTILVFHRIHMKSFYNASQKQDPEAARKKYNI